MMQNTRLGMCIAVQWAELDLDSFLLSFAPVVLVGKMGGWCSVPCVER